MRIFTAVALPPDLVEILLRAWRPLLRELPRGWAREVPPANLHVTSVFLGDVRPTALEDVLSAVRGASSGVPVGRARLGGAGAFPNPRRARVLVTRVEDLDGALNTLHRAVEAALEPLGFAPERRTYTPHVTLARLRRGPPPGADLGQGLAETTQRLALAAATGPATAPADAGTAATPDAPCAPVVDLSWPIDALTVFRSSAGRSPTPPPTPRRAAPERPSGEVEPPGESPRPRRVSAGTGRPEPRRRTGPPTYEVLARLPLAQADARSRRSR